MPEPLPFLAALFSGVIPEAGNNLLLLDEGMTSFLYSRTGLGDR
jgi:hypothetical protein